MKHIGSKKLSFAKSEYLYSILGIEPGSVSPFSLINDKNKKVIFYLDKKFLDSEKINFHPLVNTATINISTLDMISFVEKHHNSVNLLDLDLLEQL